MEARVHRPRFLAFLISGTLLAVLVVPLSLADSSSSADHAARSAGGWPSFQQGGNVSPSVTNTTPPSVTILAPSASIGDFGASQGNVWDMAEPEITDIVWRQESASFPIERRPANEGTVVRGSTGSQVLGMAFYASATDDVPAEAYHHLTYRLKIQARQDCWTNGRVGYATRWPQWYGSQVSSYPFVPHLEPMDCDHGNFCIYYLDLARNDNWPAWQTWHGASSPSDPSSWLTDLVKGFSIVPNEWCGDPQGGAPEYFELDFVYLTGDIVAREEDDYKYLVEFDVSDPDSAVVTSTIRHQEVAELRLAGDEPECDGDRFNGSMWKDFDPVAQHVKYLLPLPSPQRPVITDTSTLFLPVVLNGYHATGNDWYELDFSDDSGFTDGRSYYVCIRSDDGVNVTYEVSDAPVIRAPRSPLFGPD